MIGCQSVIPVVFVFPRPVRILRALGGAVLQATTAWLRQILAAEVVEESTVIEEPIPRNDEPRDRVLVLDLSESMLSTDWRPSRLKAAKRAAKAFAEELSNNEPDALIGAVGYGSRAATLCPLTAAREYGTIASAIDAVHTRGTANITDGVRIAEKMLKPGQRPAQIVLLSDGHHNEGPGPQRIAEKLKQRAIIECVGIGGRPQDVDEKLLKSIASTRANGTKRYRWIGDEGQLVKQFRKLAGRITRA